MSDMTRRGCFSFSYDQPSFRVSLHALCNSPSSKPVKAKFYSRKPPITFQPPIFRGHFLAAQPSFFPGERNYRTRLLPWTFAPIDDAKRPPVLHSPETKTLMSFSSKGVLARLVGRSAFCPGQVRLAAGFVTASLRPRRKLHLVTAMGTTHEWSLLFLVNPDLATCLAPGAVAISSPFGIMRTDDSVLAVSAATTVYSTVTGSLPISDFSSLPPDSNHLDNRNGLLADFPKRLSFRFQLKLWGPAR